MHIKTGGEKEIMKAGVTVTGIVLFIIGLIALGTSAYYMSLPGEVLSSVITVLGVVVGGVGAALHTGQLKVPKQ